MSNRQRKTRTRGEYARQRRWRALAWKVGIGAGLVLLTAVGLRAAGVFDPPPASVDLNASANLLAPGEVIGTRVSAQPATHIPAGQHGTYNSVPPTSGEHWNQFGVAPAPWGIKDSMLPNEVTTHNLEHGGVVIGYNAALPADDATKLKSLVRGLMNAGFRKIILEPYPPLTDAQIGLTAWTWILKLPAYDETQITKFVRAHHAGADAPEANVP